MAIRLNPYLSFDGNAAEAMAFYHSVLGGELESHTFAELGMPVPDGDEGKVMHSQLLVTEAVVLMGADVISTMTHTPAAGLPICLNGTDTDLLRGWWDGLAEGGTITTPLEVAPWGDAYGTVTDRFGIDWMFNILVAQAL